ncbi:MAG: hypothetical protein AAGA48_39470 [Myxococcota bacterium]
MFSLLALSLFSSPAAAHHGRALIDIDNDLRAPVSVWVDGVSVGTVAPFQRVAFSVRPGARDIEIVQAHRNCLLTADYVHLPPGSEVNYELDRGCGPRPVAFVARGPRGGGVAVTWTPQTFRIVRHRGPVRGPVVVRRPYGAVAPRRRTVVVGARRRW